MIVLVLSDLWLPFPGGAERLMFNLSRDLMRRGMHVVAYTGYEQPQQFDGCVVYREDTPLDGEGWLRIAAAIDNVHPDVIVTHHIYARTFERDLLATGIPIVQVVLNGKRIKGAAFAVHISRHVAERADGELLDMIITPPAFDDVIAGEHGDRIGFIKPIEHKGVELFYAIAEAMPERRFLVLRGEWQTLEDIRELQNVDFMQPVHDMRDFYAECSMVLVPSISEDAGTVGQECALNMIPCISSDVDGLTETNGGIRLASRDVELWANAIRSLDNRSWRDGIVRRQLDHLDVDAQAARLDQFAARLAALK